MHNEVDKELIVQKFLEKFKHLVKETSVVEPFITACQLIGKRLVHESLALRRQMVGEFLQTKRTIQQHSVDNSSFECGVHTKSSEPYFAEVAYKVSAATKVTVVDRDNRCLVTKKKVFTDTNEVDLAAVAIAVDTDGICHLSLDEAYNVMDKNESWKCTIMCKEFTNEQKKMVINLKNWFDDSVEVIRPMLEHVDDGCGQPHYCKSCYVESSAVKELMGHPMHCASGSCDSQLRLLRAAAVHYPALRTLLNYVYHAKRSSALINKIESDLSSPDSVESLKENLKLADLAS